MSGCKVDQQPNHWFQCARGTVGCPRFHDGRSPHCIACASGECSVHERPVLEQSLAEYRASKSEAA